MNPSLQKQQEVFKKTMLKQQDVLRQISASRPQPPPSPTPSQASSVTSVRPLNSIVHSVITFLKDLERPATINEINAHLNLSLHTQPDLLQKICLNERIIHEDETLCFKPTFTIKQKEDIIHVLKERPDMSGIDISELKEAYPRVEEACMELSRKGELYLIRPKEDGPKVIFYNDYQAQITVDQNFKQLWGHVQVPADEFELRDALDRAGLKSCSRPSTSGPGAGSSVKRAEDKKKASSRPYRRRIKITNDYLEGIDLSLDPNHNQ